MEIKFAHINNKFEAMGMLDDLKNKALEKSNAALNSIKNSAESIVHSQAANIEKLDDLKNKAIQKSNEAMASIKNSAESLALEQVAKLDFSAIKLKLEEKQHEIPELKGLNTVICVVEEGLHIYKLSDADDKEQHLVKYVVAKVDLNNSIAVLDKVMNFVPYGNLLMVLLKYLVKKKNDVIPNAELPKQLGI